MKNKRLMRAANIAFEAHRDQQDKGGNPYFFHPFAVATKVSELNYSDDYVITAYLHDVIEDSKYHTMEDMEEFSDDVRKALELLTHDKSVPYMDYIKAIKENEIARVVKLADLANNMDTNRLKEITPKDEERLEKYQKAYEYLITEDDIRHRVESVLEEYGYTMDDITDEEYKDIAEQYQEEEKGACILDGYDTWLMMKRDLD